jgi:hypothetical protein
MMAISTLISNFFLSEWIWSFTWDLWHVPLAMLLMLLLTHFFMYARRREKMIVSISGPLVAFFSFHLIIMVVFIYSLGFDYVPEAQRCPTCSIMTNCLWLGFIYSILQILYFSVLRSFYPLNLKRLAVLSVIAHTTVAFVMNIFISLYYR